MVDEEIIENEENRRINDWRMCRCCALARDSEVRPERTNRWRCRAIRGSLRSLRDFKSFLLACASRVKDPIRTPGLFQPP